MPRPLSLSERSRFDPGPSHDAEVATGDVIDLTVSNPTRVGLTGPAIASETFSSAPSEPYAPDPLGLSSARQAIAASYRERGISIDPARIVLTASSSEAYAWLFKLLCDPGEEVLIPTPSYPLFECLARLEAVRTVSYPLLREEAFRIDTATLRARIGEKTRAIVMVAPNNPTGSLVHEEDAQAIDEIAHEHGLALIVDEVFADYLLGSPPAALRRTFAGAATKSTCFILNGLSKMLLAPQLKLGWVLVGGPSNDAVLHRLSIIADTFLSVSSPAQLALPALLGTRAAIQAELAARLTENMATLERLTAHPSSGVRALRPTGGWSALVQVPRVMSEDAWVTALAREAGVRVQPGWFYDVDDGGTLVLSLIVEPPRFELGVRRLCELVSRHS